MNVTNLCRVCSYAPATFVFITGGGGDAGRKHLIAVKTYVSPWEKAMKGDENLIATLKAGMPGPIQQKDLPKWKSFNRYLPQVLTLYMLFDQQGL